MSAPGARRLDAARRVRRRPADGPPSRRRPLRHPGRTRTATRRAVPFLLTIALCAASPALPHHNDPDVLWWLVAVAILVLMAGAGVLAAFRPPTHWLATATPLLLLPAIQALRATDGNSVSGFTPLLLLPTIWFALYGRLRDVVLSIVGGALVLGLPVALVGGSRYPSANWRGAVLFVLVLATVGVLIHRLVDRSRQTSLALDASTSRFRAAFDNAPIGMALTVDDADGTARPLLVNRALCAMFDLSEDALLGRPIDSLAHPEDLETLRRCASAVTGEPGRPAQVEVRMTRRSGRVIWASVSCSVLLDAAGLRAQTVWQFEDVSARRQSDDTLLKALQTERSAAEQMRRLEQARTELISAVSHDLRTPITSSLGYAELLSEGDLGPLTDEQSATVATIVRGLNRLSNIIDELVTAAPGAAQDVADLVAVDICAAVDHAVATVDLQRSSRRQHLSRTGDVTGVQVIGDGDRLERLLVNLLGNAVKFTPEQGRICIDTHVDGTDVVIAIADSGSGIAPEQQRLIFERFYRAPRSSHEAAAGTGIGLAIVKAIVTQHGGTISVDSELGRGATFTVRLPVARHTTTP